MACLHNSFDACGHGQYALEAKLPQGAAVGFLSKRTCGVLCCIVHTAHRHNLKSHYGLVMEFVLCLAVWAYHKPLQQGLLLCVASVGPTKS